VAQQIGVSSEALPAEQIFVLRLQLLFELSRRRWPLEFIGECVKNTLKCLKALRMSASEHPPSFQCTKDTISEGDLIIKPGLAIQLDRETFLVVILIDLFLSYESGSS
jgi:hypothetical protein